MVVLPFSYKHDCASSLCNAEMPWKHAYRTVTSTGTSAPGCECTEHVPAVDLSASSQHVVVSDRQEVRFVDPVCPIRWLVVAGSSPLLLLRA